MGHTEIGTGALLLLLVAAAVVVILGPRLMELHQQIVAGDSYSGSSSGSSAGSRGASHGAGSAAGNRAGDSATSGSSAAPNSRAADGHAEQAYQRSDVPPLQPDVLDDPVAPDEGLQHALERHGSIALAVWNAIHVRACVPEWYPCPSNRAGVLVCRDLWGKFFVLPVAWNAYSLRTGHWHPRTIHQADAERLLNIYRNTCMEGEIDLPDPGGSAIPFDIERLYRRARAENTACYTRDQYDLPQRCEEALEEESRD